MKDVTDDGSPFTHQTKAFKDEENSLADFVLHETSEQRIASFVEDFAEEYKKDPEEIYMMLETIYDDLEGAGHVENKEEEIMEVLKRLEEKTGGKAKKKKK